MSKTVRQRIAEARKNVKPSKPANSQDPGNRKNIDKIAQGVLARNHAKIKRRAPIGFD